jgi:uncharacterized membrane protein YeaQ/YmgE (transglycosylase-associated protein family)
MSFMNEGRVAVLLIGLLAGWVIGNVGRSSGLRLAVDLATGAVGALTGYRTLPPLHIDIGHGLVSLVITAAFGAMCALVLIRALPFVRKWAIGSDHKTSGGFERQWKAKH